MWKKVGMINLIHEKMYLQLHICKEHDLQQQHRDWIVVPECSTHKARFAEDGANFSINSDDPMVTSTWTEQEYELVRSWGLSETHIVRSNVNAISSSFLPPAEKKAMLRKLFDVYHIQLE